MAVIQVAPEPPVGKFLHELAASGFIGDLGPFTTAQHCVRCVFEWTTEDRLAASFGGFFRDPGFLHYATPAHHLYTMANAVVCGSDGLVIVNGGIIKDTIRYLTGWEPGSMVAEFKLNESVRFRAALPVGGQETVAPVLLGFSGAWRNYGHWLRECLPRLYLYTKIRHTYPKLKVMVPRFGSDSFQQQTLDLLRITAEDTVIVEHGEAVSAQRLLMTSDFDIWSIPPFCREAAEYLSQQVAEEPGAADAEQRIHIHRQGSSRLVQNFEALLPVLKQHAIRVVDFEKLSLAEQIRTMRRAMLVIGEHGAGLANVLFCRQPCVVLELFNPSCVQPAFWSVASVMGCRFGYMVGEHFPTSDQPQPNWNTNYTIEPRTFDQAITACLASVARPVELASAAEQVTGYQSLARGASGCLVEAIAEFVTVEDMAALAVSGEDRRYVVAPTQPVLAQIRLVNAEALPPEVLLEHARYQTPDPVCLYALDAALIWGNGLITRQGKVFLQPDCIPSYFRGGMLAPDGYIPEVWQGAMSRPDRRAVVIDGMVASVLHPNLVYGHLLLEILPKLYLVSVAQERGLAFTVPVSTMVPKWVRHFIDIYVAPDRIVDYDHRLEYIQPDRVLVPSMMHSDWNFHPMLDAVVDDLRARLLADTPPFVDGKRRLFISRAGHDGEVRLENEDEIIALLLEMGFEVVLPHMLSIKAQIELFSQASIIVGEYSSALHNSLFADKGTPVVALNWLNWYQSAIGRLRQQPLMVLTPVDGRFRDGRMAPGTRGFRVDPATVRSAVMKSLALAEAAV